jgi:hypothetical protein
MLAFVDSTFWMILAFLQNYNGAVTAVATIFIGAFTFVLARVTKRQAELTAASVKVAERALIDAERPYVFVLDVKGFLEDPPGAYEDSWPWVDFVVVNHGRTPAIVTRCDIEFFINAPSQYVGEDVKSWSVFTDAPIVVVGEKIKSRRDFRFKDPKMLVPYTYQNDEYIQGILVPTLSESEELYFVVHVLYEGPFTRDHSTRSCWRWDKALWRFVPHERFSHRK